MQQIYMLVSPDAHLEIKFRKQIWQSAITNELEVQKSFIKNRVAVKLRDLKSSLLNGNASSS